METDLDNSVQTRKWTAINTASIPKNLELNRVINIENIEV